MDAFEENIQKFNSTIYGPEMMDALYRCLSLIYETLAFYSSKLSVVKVKIELAERS